MGLEGLDQFLAEVPLADDKNIPEVKALSPEGFKEMAGH